jgi:LacI family transcriptional regulator
LWENKGKRFPYASLSLHLESASGMMRRAGSAASIKAVAAMAGVSIATVSRVMNGVANKASPATVERVRQAVAALDYRPTSAGRSLRQRTSRLVAVLAANLANPAMAAIAASAEAALRERSLVMVLCDTHDRPELQDEYLREMQAQQARAVVLLGAVDSPQLRFMHGGATPIVFVNRRNPIGADKAMFVGIDNMAAGRDVARHCLDHGFRRIAILHGAMSSSATRERVEAMREALGRAGCPTPDDLVIGPAAEDHLAVGYRGAGLIIEDRSPVDAVLCTSDLIAFGVQRRFQEGGSERRTPSIIGFDDSPLNAWVAPWLTSVRIPYQAFGSAIVDMLLGAGAGAGATDRILPHQLIVRAADKSPAGGSQI